MAPEPLPSTVIEAPEFKNDVPCQRTASVEQDADPIRADGQFPIIVVIIVLILTCIVLDQLDRAAMGERAGHIRSDVNAD